MVCGQNCDGLYHFAFYLVNFGIPFDQIHLSSEAQCVSHHLPPVDCHRISVGNLSHLCAWRGILQALQRSSCTVWGITWMNSDRWHRHFITWPNLILHQKDIWVKFQCMLEKGMIYGHNADSVWQVRVTIVAKGEFQELLEQTLCNVFSSKCIQNGYTYLAKCTSKIAMEIGRTAYAPHCALCHLHSDNKVFSST